MYTPVHLHIWPRQHTFVTSVRPFSRLLTLLLLLSSLPLIPNQVLPGSIPARAPTWSTQAALPPIALLAAPGQPTLNSAYVRDIASGDGQHTAIVSSMPQQYRDAQGRWQPIDVRFVSQQGGYVNNSNALQIRVEASHPEVWMQLGSSVIGWETQALSARTSAGVTTLARPLPIEKAPLAHLDASSTTISYENSWSLPQIQEQLHSAPGQLKEQIVLQSPLTNASANLAVEAILTLPEGHTLVGEGRIQTSSFATGHALSIRDSAGATVLVLDPALSYEQGNPKERVAASYQLSPLAKNVWRIAVITPGTWLNDPARQYPIVLDPTMGVLRATEGATIGYQECNAAVIGSTINVAERTASTPPCRGLIRFNQPFLPNLPPNALISKASLIMAPTNGDYENIGSNPGTSMFVDVLQVTSSWTKTDAVTVPLTNEPTVGKTYDSTSALVYKPSHRTEFFASSWIIQNGAQGVVTDWLTTPASNFGLELRANGFDSSPRTSPQGIRLGLGFEPTSTWAQDDLSKMDMGHFTWRVRQGAGALLLVSYTAPQLQNNQYLDVTSFPATGPDFYQSYHSYITPTTNSPWTAVAVKGMVSNNAAARLPIQECTVGAGVNENCDTAASNYPTNIVMLHGSAKTVAVGVPLNSGADFYRIQASESVALPTLPNTYGAGTGSTSGTLPAGSSKLIQVYHLALAQNMRFSVRPASTGPGIHTFAIPPGATTTTRDATAEGIDGASVAVGNRAGTWAFVIVNDGQQPQPFELTNYFHMRLTVCPADAIPTDLGECQFIVWPTASTPKVTIGNVTLYSQAGFDQSCTVSTLCTTNLSQNNRQYALFLGYGTNTDRLVGIFSRAMVADHLSAFRSVTFDAPAQYALMKEGFVINGVPIPDFDAITWLWEDTLNVNTSNAQLTTGSLATLMSAPLYPGDLHPIGSGTSATVNLSTQQEQVTSTLSRTVAGNALTFSLNYSVFAEGYRTDLADTTKNVSWGVTQTAGPTVLNDVLSMRLRFGTTWDIGFAAAQNSPKPMFTYLSTASTIAHSLALGGAGSEVFAVISPDVQMPQVLNTSGDPMILDRETICQGNCLDIRNGSDIRNPAWTLPDITTGTTAPANASVFQGGSGGAAAVPFNFRSFGGIVTLKTDVCPNSGSSNKVQVIVGETKMALPLLGSDSDPAQQLDTTFVLCETSLHKLKMSLYLGEDIGIPIPPTPIFVNGVNAEISTIGSDTYEVSVGLDYFIGSSDLIRSLPGRTNLSFRTDGLIKGGTAGEAQAPLIGYDAGFQVTWNPLDISVNGEITLPSTASGKAWWIRAQLGIHIWKGQGWQNRYSWLPNDDTTHFTGSGDVTIRVPQGGLFEQDLLVTTLRIPPHTIELTKLSGKVGEFCTNGACSTYEYGAEAKFSFDVGPLGTIDVGVYAGEGGLDFILGSGGKTLIDQYGGTTSQSVALSAAGYRVLQVDPNAPTVERDISVAPGMQSLIAGMDWGHGTPQLALVRPDGTAISLGNAASQGAYASRQEGEPGNTLLIVQNPQPGTWKLRVSGATPADTYRAFALLNKSLPTVQNLQIGASTVSSSNTPGGAMVPITWTAAPAGSNIGVSLYYTHTNSLGETDTGVIVENLDAAAGQYQWDVSYVGAGSYEVSALIRDGIKPTAPDVGVPRAFGVTQVKAAGQLTMSDTTPPPAPNNLSLTKWNNNILACWTPNNVPDLAGYVIAYQWHDPINPASLAVTRYLKVVARPPDNPVNGKQCARIGGFQYGEAVGIQVYSYDINNIYSSFGPSASITISSFPTPFDSGPNVPSGFTATITGSGSADFIWNGVRLASGYLLHIQGPTQDNGQSVQTPRLVPGRGTSTSVAGLRGGCTYTFAIQANDSSGRLSERSSPVTLRLSNNVDANSDGVPDDWMACYGLTSLDSDDDGDGLTNREEYQLQTDPHLRDTDGDGFLDGHEKLCGSNPRSWQSRCVDGDGMPSMASMPIMQVTPDLIQLVVYKGQGLQHSNVTIITTAAGVFVPLVSSDTAWMSASSTDRGVALMIDPSSLQAGKIYSANLKIVAPSAALTQPASITVPVRVLLYDGLPMTHLFLPSVLAP